MKVVGKFARIKKRSQYVITQSLDDEVELFTDYEVQSTKYEMR